MRTATFATQSRLNGFNSIQILVNFENFKLSWNISLSIMGLKSPFISYNGHFEPLNGFLFRERFYDSLKISEFTRNCMENH